MTQMTEKYNDLSIAYEKLFSLFLIANTPIKEMDELLGEAKIVKVTEDDKNKWQKNSKMGLDYFYIMSRPRIEYLDEAEQDILSDMISSPSEAELEKYAKFIAETFNRVMCVNYKKPDEATCIGPYPDEKFCFDNDAIVLGVSLGTGYDENDNMIQGKYDGKIREILDDFKENMLPEISKDMKSKFQLYIDD